MKLTLGFVVDLERAPRSMFGAGELRHRRLPPRRRLGRGGRVLRQPTLLRGDSVEVMVPKLVLFGCPLLGKRVRSDRERVEAPIRREEVTVDRVPVEGEATEAEIGEDEVRIPLTEEEVVVEKRPVAKEEVRIRKDVVEDTEVVEEDVRREEVEIDDQTERRP